MAKALAHPTRVRIIRVLDARETRDVRRSDRAEGQRQVTRRHAGRREERPDLGEICASVASGARPHRVCNGNGVTARSSVLGLAWPEER